MTHEKQIAELAKAIEHTFEIAKNIGAERPSSHMIAVEVYNAGYRIPDHHESQVKAGDWVDVHDRLPDKSGIYLVHTEDEGLCMKAFFRCFADDAPSFRRNVTHWMPLPEPPKMKGGAE